MSEKPAHQISPLPQEPILGTLPRSERPMRRTLASGRNQSKPLSLLVSPEHFVSFPFTKKQPAAEPSISSSRLRHWLAPPLGTHLREGVLSRYLYRFSYWESVLSSAASCNLDHRGSVCARQDSNLRPSDS